MANQILFIFEGKTAESQIVSNLQKFFLNKNTTIKCVLGAEIYQIYKEIAADDDLDIFNLIKERNDETQKILEDYKRNDFAEIYMFFDYDGHSTLANDTKLAELLEFFNEETEKGKLYISYPMVESLKHICSFDTFKELTVECKENINYKRLVNNEALNELNNFTIYTLDIWKQLINIHLKKMNFVTVGSLKLPNNLISQYIVFEYQLAKYIKPNSTVAVLSAFPMFLYDYYGNVGIKKRIE